MKEDIIPRLRQVLALLIYSICFFYIYYNYKHFAPIFSIPWTGLLYLTILSFVHFTVTGLTFYYLVKMVAVNLNPIEILGLTFLSNIANYLGPSSPGVVIKGFYLKRQKTLPYTHFATILAANSFIIFFVAGFIGLLLLGIMWIQLDIFPVLLGLICAALLTLSILPFLLHIYPSNRGGRLWERINRAIEGFNLLKGQKSALITVCGTLIGQYVIIGWTILTVYQLLGMDITVTTALMIGLFTSISNFFTITPNNLGFQEIVIAYLYTISGSDFNNGLVGAGILRAIHLLLTFGLTPILTYFMLKSVNLSFKDIRPGKAEEETHDRA